MFNGSEFPNELYTGDRVAPRKCRHATSPYRTVTPRSRANNSVFEKATFISGEELYSAFARVRRKTPRKKPPRQNVIEFLRVLRSAVRRTYYFRFLEAFFLLVFANLGRASGYVRYITRGNYRDIY